MGREFEHLKRICANCDDYNNKEKVCTIRNLIHKDKSRSPMPRKPKQKGCEAFMYKIEATNE